MGAGGLTVAVTGPTGDVGRALLRSLDRDANVERVLGMARRPFDPGAAGLRKTTYRQGDVLDPDALEDLFEEADVVVHLAFVIMGSPDETRRVNLEGSRNVFRAAADAARVRRIVYTSSVAAYGFHADNPQPLTEDVEVRETDAYYYSAQKAELEDTLVEVLDGTDTDAYVFRPCLVAGADALLLVEALPFVGLTTNLPGVLRKAIGSVPLAKPVMPDTGVPFQLVHADDVALALRAAVDGRGEPGVFNLAADAPLSFTELAKALGWRAVPVPVTGMKAIGALMDRVPGLPPEARWMTVLTEPALMDCAKARRVLRWRPRHDGHVVLHETVDAARRAGLVA